MDELYTVIVKTGEAEIRAIENSRKEVLDKLFPIIEITRGRKITKNKIESYPFDKRLEKLKKAFKGQTVCLDLTSEETLSSFEIERLYDPYNGYQNWIDFLLKVKEENVFGNIIPSIVLNGDDDDFEENLLLQISHLQKNFDEILYRNPILDENCYEDFELIKDKLGALKMWITVDCGYTPQSTHNNFAEKALSRIENISSILGDKAHFIICSTSFPNNVRDLGDVDSDLFSISEIDIQSFINRSIPNIIYGDYASINPVRNDTVVMARGWIPRIDVPLKTEIYYHKQRRPKGISAYASTYNLVARLVTNDTRFPSYLTDNWGIEQIINCSEGGSPSSSPSFWISVRMNIHIEQQVLRIYS